MELSSEWDNFSMAGRPSNRGGGFRAGYARGKKPGDDEEDYMPQAAAVAQGAPASPVGGGFGQTNIGAPTPDVLNALNVPIASRTPAQKKLLDDRRVSEELALSNGLHVKDGIRQTLLDQEAVPRLAKRDVNQAVAYDTARTQELAKVGYGPNGKPLPTGASTVPGTQPNPGPTPSPIAPFADNSALTPKPVGYALRDMGDGTFRGVSGQGQIQNFASKDAAMAYYRPETAVPGAAPQAPGSMNPPVTDTSAAASDLSAGAASSASSAATAAAAQAPGSGAPTAQEMMAKSVSEPFKHPAGSYADTYDKYGVAGMVGRAASDFAKSAGSAQNYLWNDLSPRVGEGMVRAVSGQGGVNFVRSMAGEAPQPKPRKLPSAEEVQNAPAPAQPNPLPSLLSTFDGSAAASPFTAPSTRIKMNSRALGQPRRSGFQLTNLDPFSSR